MSRQLELKDWIGYVPHNMCVMWPDGEINNTVFKESDYRLSETEVDFIVKGKCKPILRPESDLYRPIQQKDYNNGEPFVPIEKLARVAEPNFGWMASVHSDVAYAVTINGTYKFYWNATSKCFCCECHQGLGEGVINRSIPNTYQLFDLLHLWKIDYRGLIPAGLAVSTETLKTNPYE